MLHLGKLQGSLGTFCLQPFSLTATPMGLVAGGCGTFTSPDMAVAEVMSAKTSSGRATVAF